MAVGRFIAGIGALIWDQRTDRYLLLKRSTEKDFAPGVWECVTGRVDQGEGFEDALHREVREETGAEVRPLFFVGTTRFYRGERRPENELLGVVYCCSIQDPEAIRIGPEHASFRWLSAEEALAMLQDRHPSERWLKQIIERSEMTRRLLPEALGAFHQEKGFQLD